MAHGVDWEHFREAACGKRETQVAADVPAAAEPRGGDCVRRDVERHLEKEESGEDGAEHRWLPTSRRQQSGEGAGECVPLTACRQPPAAPVVGFFGLLSEWVDQDLILRLAEEFPQATILLIGKADVDVARLQRVPNIQLPGPKPFTELPAHIARFTVGIIPFVVNDLTRAVNPIKLREMLAAGCPVVSTAMP
jgi:glycosyltransferase involved in cell wall biosynthesis